MASVTKCTQYTPPTTVFSGTVTPTYTAKWTVEVDDVIPGAAVLDLASKVSASGETRPLPRFGDPLSYTSPGGEVYRDDSAFALGFDAKPLFQDGEDPKKWRVTVTWRPPTPGNDEQPGTLNLPPLLRAPEYWIEYNNVPYDETVALNVDTNETELMTNSAGQVHTPVPISILRPQIVMAVNVSSPIAALNINQEYETSVNQTSFNLLGKTIAPRTCRFIRAESGRAQYQNGTRYYRMHVRVELSRAEYIEYRPNVGDYALDASGERDAVLDSEGFPLPGPFNLASDGTLATGGATSGKNYLVYFERDFARLLRAI